MDTSPYEVSECSTAKLYLSNRDVPRLVNRCHELHGEAVAGGFDECDHVLVGGPLDVLLGYTNDEVTLSHATGLMKRDTLNLTIKMNRIAVLC